MSDAVAGVLLIVELDDSPTPACRAISPWPICDSMASAAFSEIGVSFGAPM